MTDGDIIIVNEGLQWWGAEQRAVRGPKTCSRDVFCRPLARRDGDDLDCGLGAGVGSPTGNRRTCDARPRHVAREVLPSAWRCADTFGAGLRPVRNRVLIFPAGLPSVPVLE